MFKNKLLLEVILIESLKTAREYAEANSISADVFELADKMDGTPTKKLIHQILKWYMVQVNSTNAQYSGNQPEHARRVGMQHLTVWSGEKSHVNRYLKLFAKLSGQSITEPIEKFKTSDEFSQFMEPIYQEYREKQEAKQKEIIFENDKIVIFRPLTKGAVCVYGFQTKWCITQEEQNYYESYRKNQGYTFYYVFSKIFRKKSNPFAKIALCINKQGDIAQAFDNTDRDVGPALAKEWITDNDVPDEVFSKLKAVPISFEEKWGGDALRAIGIEMNDDGQTYKILNRGYGSKITFNNDFFDANGKLIFKFTTSESSVEVNSRNCRTLENMPESVVGDVMINQTSITTMEGCPKTITGNLVIYYNQNLISLNGCPEKVKTFDCRGNRNIETLEHAPKEVSGNFICSENNLHTLVGSPRLIPGTFNCSSNARLSSLGGGPQIVKGNYEASNTQVTSIVGMLEVGTLILRSCNVKTFGNPNLKVNSINVSHNPLENFNGLPTTMNELVIGRVNTPDVIYPINNWGTFKHIPRIVINASDRHYFNEFPRGYKTRFKFLNWT